MEKSVLTISSHVIHGYVGNKAIVFPLQIKGWEVDNLNTVNYSNHTGYGIFKGSVISNELLKKLLDSPPSSFLITGYLPNSSVVDQLKDYLLNNHRVYLLDPILGDEGQLYVDPSCVDSYRELLNEVKVDIITPNHFELELLTDSKIQDHDQLILAIENLKRKIKFVVITSYQVGEFIYCLVAAQGNESIKGFKIPIIDGYFTGVGDLFTALLIDKLYDSYYTDLENKDALESLCKAVNQVLSIMEKVLHHTFNTGLSKNNGKHPNMGTLEIGKFELNLIEAVPLFESTEENFEVFDFHELKLD
ncbi:putative pyridoxal kinase Bud16p [[Candida] jaroonii]|uniref:Pyridoxal kinase Bud16p n=1 Tax=[Candida] jaroonii TaxID=467808 RepID=A0ACA9Y1M4_9ASCO|nr:putative pyridoxal kinase Bud16p [[Candida] jaroonii]